MSICSNTIIFDFVIWFSQSTVYHGPQPKSPSPPPTAPAPVRQNLKRRHSSIEETPGDAGPSTHLHQPQVSTSRPIASTSHLPPQTPSQHHPQASTSQPIASKYITTSKSESVSLSSKICHKYC